VTEGVLYELLRRHYEQCVAALRRELGIGPSAETKQLLLTLAPAR
jgi:hypothetical protein